MNVELTDSTAVLALWWTTLAVTVLVVVPLAIHLLHRTWRAARMIERYTAETLEAASGIADHTRLVPALDETAAAAGPIVEKAGALARGSSRLAELLRSRAGLSPRGERGGPA